MTDQVLGFRPCGERVLLQREPVKERTAGGIVIPDVAKGKMCTARIVAVGKTVTDYVVGDRIAFEAYAPVPIVLNTVQYDILQVSDILGVYDQEVEHGTVSTGVDAGAAGGDSGECAQ